MVKNNKVFLKLFLRKLLKITIAGFIIGFFHEYEIGLAFLLGLKVIRDLYNLGFKNGKRNWAIPIGMFVTGIGGFIVEIVGTHYNLWEYHDVSGVLPHWLFLAWMLAFTFVYKIEKELFKELVNPTPKNRMGITFFILLLFPALGELITINLGVWTYYLPYKFFGLPMYALLGLVIFHMLIKAILYLINTKLRIEDIELLDNPRPKF